MGRIRGGVSCRRYFSPGGTMKFVDDFISYNRDFTGCPDIFLKWSALLALSAVAGYKHVHRRGNWDVRPNLWVLLLGNSSSYKSTGLSSMRRLLFEAQKDVLASQEYSHEALIEDIANNPHRQIGRAHV